MPSPYLRPDKLTAENLYRFRLLLKRAHTYPRLCPIVIE